ncbi:MAG: hypothetical protein ACXVB0_13850 [Mucilaginibacter sp.]
MKKSYSVIFLCLLLPMFSLAQGNYKPGYVVTLKGDTVHGFISYGDWDSNPKAITFKTGVSNNPQKFTPGAIRFFSVDGIGSYQRYSGTISMDATDADHISNGRDPSFRIDTVFLKLIQKGSKVAFYSYDDGFKTRYYIAEKPDFMPTELGYHLYTNSGDASQNGRTVLDNEYMKQLFALAEKYNVLNDKLQADIQHSEYRKYDILDIVSKINNISKAEYIEKYQAKTRINLFATIALSMNTITPTKNYQKAGGKTETSYMPAISFGADLMDSPNSDKLVFRVEATLAESQYKSIYIYTGSPFVPVRYSYDQLAIALAPQIIYNFYHEKDFRMYVGAGVALTFYQYFNATYDIDYAATKVTNAHLVTSNFFNTFRTPFVFKAGVMFNIKIGAFVKYVTAAPVTNDYYFSLNSSSMQIGLSYTFH